MGMVALKDDSYLLQVKCLDMMTAMVVHGSMLVACHHGQDHANLKMYLADMEGKQNDFYES